MIAVTVTAGLWAGSREQALSVRMLGLRQENREWL